MSVSIDIPQWVYDGVVRVDNPTVLTLPKDYFLLDQGNHRFLHRLCRRAAGKGEAIFMIVVAQQEPLEAGKLILRNLLKYYKKIHYPIILLHGKKPADA